MVIPPITLLVGKEAVLRDERLSRIRSALFKDPSARELNQHVLDASRDTLADILTPSQTAPFLAEKRLVIVDAVDDLPDRDRKALLAHLKSGSSYTVWILMTDARNTKTAFLKQLAEISEVVFCDAPYKDAEVKSWIRKKFFEWKKAVEPRAVEVMFERVGKNMTVLAHAVEQLVLYAGDRKTVTAQDAEALLGESADQNVFHLYDALKTKRLDEALKILNRLKTQGRRSYEIIASLAWQFDRMLRIKNKLHQGMGADGIASEFRMHHRFLRSQSLVPEGNLLCRHPVLRSSYCAERLAERHAPPPTGDLEKRYGRSNAGRFAMFLLVRRIAVRTEHRRRWWTLLDDVA